MTKRYILSTGALLVTAVGAFAQEAATEAAAPAQPNSFNWAYNNIFLILAAIVVILTLLMLYRVMGLMIEMQRAKFIQEHGLEAAEKANMLQSESVWRKLYKSMTKATPIEKEQDIDLGHDYDGIRELDNSLPPWWVWMFYLTILFSGVYMWWYHWSDNGPDQIKEYEMAMEEGQKVKDAYLAKMADAINENSVTAATAAADLDAGKATFKTYCAACHLETGAGSVGPNLTDEYWIHGGGIKNVFKTIKYGVPAKGMISWKDQLRPSEMKNVASYILTLQGTNPPGAKAAQGDIWKEEADAATPAAADTIQTK